MSKATIATDIALLSLIRKSDERTLNKLYHQYRDKFVNWSLGRYNCDAEQAGDVFQRAFTILYLNIKNGKVIELTATLETYLFGIGKNVFREQFKDKFRHVQELDERFGANNLDESVIEKQHQRHIKSTLGDLLKSLGEPCNTVLKLYYFCRFSMESIAQEVGYKNEAVAKKKKYQCLQGLKKTVRNQPHLQDALLNS